MRPLFFYFLSIFMLFSCKQENAATTINWINISENVKFNKDDQFLHLKSGKFDYKISRTVLPYKKVVLLNASLVGYFTALNLENKIVGVSSPEYIYSKKIKDLINTGKIQEVGNEQKYNIEKIIALKPDVIFTNYIASFENTYDLLRKNNIELIFLDEYLENEPLAKAKYLMIFGELFNTQKKAEILYNEIEKNYESLKSLAMTSTEKPVVLANEMYGNQWFLPGGKSNLAQFISDANANYINSENKDHKAVPMSFEEVFVKAKHAKFWVNIGNHKLKKELLQINPNYEKMPLYNHGNLYTLSGKEVGKSNDYFESGVIRADLVLKDYIKIFHPQLLPDYNLTYLKELK